tara:strand:+ start:997 stop:1521 length:525 start_codon:yes stop_codon:yes gene_type:complete
MIDITFIPICSFFTASEKVKYSAVHRKSKNSLRKFVAALKIYKFWYYRKTSTWMNAVIKNCLNLHAFSNRISISNAPINKLEGGLPKLKQNKNKKKFFDINSYMMCDCQNNEIDTAIYYSMGHSMFKSIPYLDFCCRSCIDKVIYHFQFDDFNVYQFPEIFFYPDTTDSSKVTF